MPLDPDELVLGRFVTVHWPDMGIINEPVRIVEITRNHLVPGDTRVTLGTRTKRMTDILLSGRKQAQATSSQVAAVQGSVSGTTPGGTGTVTATPPTATAPTISLYYTVASGAPTVFATVNDVVTSVKFAGSLSGIPLDDDVRAATAVTPAPFSELFDRLTAGIPLYVAAFAYTAGGTESSKAIVTISIDSGAVPRPSKWSWYKRGTDMFSDAGVTPQVTNGGSIQQWNDESGSTLGAIAHHATRTGAGKPTLDTSVQYLGANTIKFAAASSQYFDLPTFGGNPQQYFDTLNGAELFIVLKAVSSSPGLNRAAYKMATEGNGGAGTYYPASDGHIKDSFGDNGRTDVGVPPVSISSAFRIYNVSAKNGLFTARLDGSQIFTTSTYTFAMSHIAPYLGADDGVFFDGWIAEVILYRAILTADQRALTYDYLTGNASDPT
jgi:hypothetical protein